MAKADVRESDVALRGTGASMLDSPRRRRDRSRGVAPGTADLEARVMGLEVLCCELRQTLAERDEHLNQVIRSTIETQEAERESICLEVHDGVAQTLASAFQLLQAYEGTPSDRPEEARSHVLRAAALVRKAIRETREVINSITPSPLSELGLVTTLRQELRRFEEEARCRVEFDASRIRLAREMEVALYRIVHEAVTNVRKHAQSDRLMVRIKELDGRIAIQVRDWGVGFDPNLVERTAMGRTTGLFSMRKRSEILGGTFKVETRPGHGTEVTVEVPLRPGQGA